MQAATFTLVHEPFSRSLGRIMERERFNLTANRVLEGTDGRGLYLALIWFGYLASFVVTLYFALIGALIVKHLGNWLHATLHWLGMTQ